jgi:hypothetical protein
MGYDETDLVRLYVRRWSALVRVDVYQRITCERGADCIETVALT